MDISSSSVNGDCEEYELYASLPKLTPGPFFLHLYLGGTRLQRGNSLPLG